MTKCFSLKASRNWCLRSTFSSSGLRSTVTDLGDGTVIHCWVLKTRKETRPDLLLLDGLEANAMWQWGPDIIPRLIRHFNLYVSDLVIFDDSFMTRTDSFQAECVYRVMAVNLVARVRVVGLSYGEFMAYRMAVQYKEAAEILLPETPEKMRELMRFAFVKPPVKTPNCLWSNLLA